jgi:uncharacterized protein YndB with AHSA1/START domain
MSDTRPRGSTRSTAFIKASPEAVYRAFTEPDALVTWFAPGALTASLHRFDLRVGGGYEMSLHYPDSEQGAPGKTTAREDRYAARFVELTPPSRIVQTIVFDAADPAFSGEMTMTVTLAPAEGGTLVTIAFDGIPPGIRPEDNERGTEETLANLARFVAQR